MSERLPALLDCRGLMDELGVRRSTAEAIMRRLPKVQIDDRRDHVGRLIDDHTVPVEPTSVYLAHDKRGRLLYVGITSRHSRRLHEHNKTSKWWDKAATITLEHFPTRQQAADREHALIAEHAPPYNQRPGTAPILQPRAMSPDRYRSYITEVLP